MKIALNESEDIIKDSTKLISKANKELTRIKDPKGTELVAVLNREVEVIIKRKKFAYK